MAPGQEQHTLWGNISVCLRLPSSRSPECGPGGAGESKSGSKTVTPEYGVERGRECVQTRACLAHCTDELPLASPRCARVPLSRMLGGSVCGQAAKCAWRLFPRVRAHTHTPTPTHTNTHKHKHTRIRDGLGVASGACLRPPSSRSPERGPSGAGGLQSGSKTVTPEYGVERGREKLASAFILF